MNLIVIVSDTFRRDHLGCYGNGWISTPHLDRFAEKAIVFDRTYAASFPTVPNRRDIFTGRYTFTYSQWAPLPPEEIILAEELGKAGYATMMVLDTPHIIKNGYYFDRGFSGFEWIRGQENDRWQTAPAYPRMPCVKTKLRSPEATVKVHQRNVHWRRYEEDTFVARTMREACLWLERNYRQHSDFFLYVDTFDPHEPWDAPQWYLERYDEPNYTGANVSYPVYGPSDYLTIEELRHCRALYAAEVTLVDRWVGRLLERIEDMGLLRDTAVVFTTDHGFYHGEHGLMGKSHITPEESRYVPLYEEVARIPLIAYAPGCEPRRESVFV
ncbi:MAG: sulfatase, partial [Chloroflexi bacterium]|nr:sulfatase [Chloroflexota bacterium]